MTFREWYNASVAGNLTDVDLVIALLTSPFVSVYYGIRRRLDI